MTFLTNLPPYAFLAPYYARVGHPEAEKELLRSRSPLFKAEQIKVPLLLAHGANDPGIKPVESGQIMSVLKRNNIF
ncbi:hypothetical protein KDH_00670 [Dictyobacter sp. S3.2.2.5]|uniref:Peptidase S9 prolyl oligopeptidase catalytic domain-containing protein n=1 Tax=Dictyobacter halimunensis TaxID=3026934 RepID=A0ABQ6FL11_9CHLR|nr:hypothetical protein KDH_00670 [Dictyobacter sp. S3.2.2.5]